MSLHRNDFLVSSHQAEMHRHAADRRLAQAARQSSSKEKRTGFAERTLTGLVGKRGNQDAYKIRTATATVGIRGSSGDTLDCTAGCVGVTPAAGNLAPGVYHTTYTGSYTLTNPAGEVAVGPGQFGFVPGLNLPPVLLPSDPGLGLGFMPFSLIQGGAPGAGGPGQSQECVVR